MPKIYTNRVELIKIHKNWINSAQHPHITHASEASTKAFLWFVGIVAGLCIMSFFL